MTAAGVFHVAVIGSGPAGFYAAEALFRSGAPFAVDMFEKLPVPYGLVRFGVAPDHPKLKQVTSAFDRIAATPGFRFIGGVNVGRDVTIDELLGSYDAVILATGADVGRTLGVQGEALEGSHQAGDFVAWYNGHPEFRHCRFDLRHEAATIVGHGNVALDVARILAKTADQLRRTDIARHALDVLAESRIRQVHVVGRGSPSQARFSAKELRDFLELDGCDAWVDGRDLGSDEFAPEHPRDPELSEKLALLRQLSHTPATSRRRCLFRFGLSPLAIRGQGRVEAIVFERGSKAIEEIPCGLVLSSVGRRTAPLAGVPYDDVRGVHGNIAGRVIRGGSVVCGLYVCGWSKRGPSGTIGTNRGCAMATAEAVIADLPGLAARRSKDAGALIERLRERVGRIVSYDDWASIDAAERRSGAPAGKPREKFVAVSDMLAAIGAPSSKIMADVCVPLHGGG
jgi:ferredoxin--NADP+ reductase